MYNKKKMMFKSNNVLSPNTYLISDELHEILSTGRSLYAGEFKGRAMVKYEPGIYLVSMRVLNVDKKVLVYSYIYYPKVFLSAIQWFIVGKVDFKHSLIYSE